MDKSKELEEAKRMREFIKEMDRRKQDITYNRHYDFLQDIETLLNYIDNSISKEVIKEKIEDYKERMRYYQDEHIIVDDEYYRYETKVEELQELLERK